MFSYLGCTIYTIITDASPIRWELLQPLQSWKPARTFTEKKNRSVRAIINDYISLLPKVAELTRSWTGKWFELHKIAKVKKLSVYFIMRKYNSGDLLHPYSVLCM